MPASDLRVVKRFTEFKPKTEIKKVPTNTRGLYALLKYRKKTNNYNVVYVELGDAHKIITYFISGVGPRQSIEIF